MPSLSEIQPGYLVIIEGGDGLGKSTQLNMLKNQLESQGRRTVTYDFPNKSGTPIGQLIGDFLRGRFGQVTPEFLGLAFAADRLVARKSIIEALSAGTVVLCDRYVASNIAFQGAKIPDDQRRAQLDDLLRWLEYDVYELPRPDLEIVLTASDRHYLEGAHLVRANDPTRAYAEGQADIHEASSDLQRAVNLYFRSLHETPALRKVDIEDTEGNRRSVEEMAAIIWGAVKAAIQPSQRG
ncbi:MULTISPECIES: dTMP kinase [Pseudomonadaceae]|uniref:Thymidylate kinase n=1 Tax=Aquipseudomonas alcaligenes (strain ATCC 14909 / DSM 50342 / CCUG 1425 / JCM 20561 / NBRC 14159 / NCIMB 9945 / NCTC 10367 / 1577) TaxID=1215092 RepID=U2Z227_AQUA1|nr:MULTISPECIES: thymidylate kinase [Pseudomonas]MWV15195.1 thymidylate kinase [Pseudomonas sp. L-22-4S-12]GAD61801.1 thymidylate kinase [Pseudomonas alcaligenes NBRC 14159]SUD13407.1 thymidylate kinase [Pseudomonas alcaligenes]